MLHSNARIQVPQAHGSDAAYVREQRMQDAMWMRAGVADEVRTWNLQKTCFSVSKNGCCSVYVYEQSSLVREIMY